MARIFTVEPSVHAISGKVSKSDRVYFRHKNGRTYQIRIDNPYQGDPSDIQNAVRNKFRALQAHIQAMPNENPEQYALYEKRFKAQRKYFTLRGYIFAKMWDTFQPETDNSDNTEQSGD